MGARGPKGDKLISDALRIAMLRKAEEAGTDGKARSRVHAMADTVAARAAKGEDWAVNYVTDRLEGKAIQATQNDTTVNMKVTQANSDAESFESRVLSLVTRSDAVTGDGKPH